MKGQSLYHGLEVVVQCWWPQGYAIKRGVKFHTAMPFRPSHWPGELEYLTSPRYHSSVPVHVRNSLQSTTGALNSAPSQRPSVVIRPITDETHPAKGQYGLFTSKKIPPRTHILDYIGEVHCNERPESDYDLSLCHHEDGSNVGIDASKMGNEARFINDFRGVASRPNALFEECRTAAGELRMSVWSGPQGIKKGDEILVSYGKGFWKARTAQD
ncbi:hypothetical protein PHLCEN_2v6666 [Hermanssonia centrifuga]|uniref:SET domain-containing protein n=1 Tax=Hermanssonia centrifuga TaxID=98765 RepID=A0A2R6NYX9_9APHY|nr:hypothetical protein PHLCEN_2v6666 [Hermanssonia centrifuga]